MYNFKTIPFLLLILGCIISFCILSTHKINHNKSYLPTKNWIWIRPTPETSEQIRLHVKEIHEMGFKAIVLETYYHGGTIFPSKVMKNHKFPVIKPEFKQKDYLRTWVEEAHAQGLELHAWFETFYLSSEDFSLILEPIIKNHSQWLNKQLKDYNSQMPSPWTEEHDAFFLDPANLDVQNFLTELVKEIVLNYDVDGINFDYIRYPKPSCIKNLCNTATEWGYTNFAINEFKQIYGFSPLYIKPNSNDNRLWQNYRENKVSQFLDNINQIKSQRDFIISTAVMPSKYSSYKVKQDWQAWAKNNKTNIIIPLIGSKSQLETYRKLKFISKTLKDANSNTRYLTAVFDPYQYQNLEKFKKKTYIYKILNIHGLVVFDYNHLDSEYKKFFKKHNNF